MPFSFSNYLFKNKVQHDVNNISMIDAENLIKEIEKIKESESETNLFFRPQIKH